MKHWMIVLMVAAVMVSGMVQAGGETELALGRQCMAVMDLTGAEAHFRAAMREGNLMAHYMCASVRQMKGSPADLREAARVLRAAMRLPDADVASLQRLIQMLESSATANSAMNWVVEQNRSNVPSAPRNYHNWQMCPVHGRYDASLTFRCPACSAPRYTFGN